MVQARTSAPGKANRDLGVVAHGKLFPINKGFQLLTLVDSVTLMMTIGQSTLQTVGMPGVHSVSLRSAL